ncbi:hypothetical protein D1816_16195 [Aquimarina sp. AD10]|uniref:hypothetical protein n=1 Tax=Aquimarina sp. AD10 TaxID=1714849 RepID=UPI000E545A50|nr:hypothetical protein [Aquimarina sp. AD10]AXT61831.1 hypothetical protein D1816_16195 [Aquimarina sp. AD10]RKN02629.1 hypothetical protein D7033_00320 [Aquimarina sp. AD10]
MNLILFFFVVPAGLVFASSSEVLPSIFLYHNIFFYTTYLFSKIKWNFNSPTLKFHQSGPVLLTITVIGIIPFIVEYAPYINLKNLLLIDVYETRTLVSQNIKNTYTAYTYSWFSRMILPIIIVLSIYFGNRKNLILSVLLLLFLYLCGAHKMVFIGLIFVLIFYKYDYLEKTRYFLLVMTGFICISLLATLFFDFTYLWDVSFRRVLILTALLDYCYFDFFTYNEPLYWSHSFLSTFVDYKYDVLPEYVISEVYFNKPDVNANVGIISDGFKNLRTWGILISIILTSLYFSILNSLNISPKFFGLFVLLVFSFLNGALSTILLTHGGILLLLLAIFVLQNTKQRMD